MSNIVKAGSRAAIEKTGERLTVEDLSPDQYEAYEQIRMWVDGGYGQPVLSLGGFAGCGKTTLLGVFAKRSGLKPIAFCTYTGKASSVLRRKLLDFGVLTLSRSLRRDEISGPPYCGTIHGLIYAPIEIFKCEKCKTTSTSANVCLALQKDETPCGGMMKRTGETSHTWAKREELDREYKLIIVDEASMVSDDMLMDLRGYGIPILAVGDHGQLPPVNGIGSLMLEPDIRLEKIHRQAESNPIIQLSKIVRETGRLDRRLADGKHIIFDSLGKLPAYVEQHYKDASVDKLFNTAMICYTNARRVTLNQEARKARGFVSPEGRTAPLQKGDQVICLRNQKDEGVYNGMRALVTGKVFKKTPSKDSSPEEIANGEPPWKLFADLDFIEEGISGEFGMCADQFGRPYTFRSFDEMFEERKIRANTWEEAGGLFDFGYALTCHKAQGSQFADVILVIDGFGRMGADEQRRWMYTAITRSSERITILT